MGILKAPEDTKVKVGETATFSCDVTKNTEFVPTVVWYKSKGSELKAEASKRKITVTQKSDSTLSVLELIKIEIADKGE